MSNLRDSLSLPAASAATWLAVLRRYITLIVLANLLWEIAHLPLYAMWQKGSAGGDGFRRYPLYRRRRADREHRSAGCTASSR